MSAVCNPPFTTASATISCVNCCSASGSDELPGSVVGDCAAAASAPGNGNDNTTLATNKTNVPTIHDAPNAFDTGAGLFRSGPQHPEQPQCTAYESDASEIRMMNVKKGINTSKLNGRTIWPNIPPIIPPIGPAKIPSQMPKCFPHQPNGTPNTSPTTLPVMTPTKKLPCGIVVSVPATSPAIIPKPIPNIIPCISSNCARFRYAYAPTATSITAYSAAITMKLSIRALSVTPIEKACGFTDASRPCFFSDSRSTSCGPSNIL